MSKFLILIILILNCYICQKKERIEIFEINPNIITEKEITVQSGQEFCIKISTFIKSYVLLNNNENIDSIPLIKTDSITEHYEGEDIGGRKGYLLYYFKANSITKEPKLLKYTDTYSYLKQSNPEIKVLIKVNVN